MAIYPPSDFEQHPGSYLHDPKLCPGKVLYPVSLLDNVPERDFVLQKFRYSVWRAYLGRMLPLQGTIKENKLGIHDGMHRALMMYLLEGEQASLPFNLSEMPLQLPQHRDVLDYFDRIIQSEGIHDFVREEVNFLDNKVTKNGLKQSLGLAFWNWPERARTIDSRILVYRRFQNPGYNFDRVLKELPF